MCGWRGSAAPASTLAPLQGAGPEPCHRRGQSPGQTGTCSECLSPSAHLAQPEAVDRVVLPCPDCWVQQKTGLWCNWADIFSLSQKERALLSMLVPSTHSWDVTSAAPQLPPVPLLPGCKSIQQPHLHRPWAQPEPSIDFCILKDLLLFLLALPFPPSPKIPTPWLAE